MLTYDLDKIEGSIYEHIYQCIKEDIQRGELEPNTKLPSKRSFAKNNGISTITVLNAYDQLMSEGYIYSIPKKGYYVSDIATVTPSPKKVALTLDITLPEPKKNYKIDLSSNQTDPKTFPFSIWAKLLRENISNNQDQLMIPSPTGGIWELRNAIAQHLKSFRGMLVDPNQIIVGAGTEYLYGLLIQLIGNDKIYCVENPGYDKIVKIYKQYNIECKYVAMDEHGITISGLQKANAQIAHISPTHHFPTGITIPVSRRYELLAWANEENGRYIIEDDYDSEFRPSGKPIPPLQSIDACEKVIYINTFSKSLTSTMRMSYMVLPVHLINRFYKELSFYSCTVSNFEQYTLARFITAGYFEKHINRMRLFYSRQREQVLQCIANNRLKEHCTVIENDSGLHFLLLLDTKLSDQEVTQRLATHGIHLKALSDYNFSNETIDTHKFIINYSNLDVQYLDEAFDKIYEYCLA